MYYYGVLCQKHDSAIILYINEINTEYMMNMPLNVTMCCALPFVFRILFYFSQSSHLCEKIS